jgi:hypothetical protein
VRIAACVADALLVRLETAARGVDEHSGGLAGVMRALPQEAVRTAAHHCVRRVALAEVDVGSDVLRRETGSVLGADTDADRAGVARRGAYEAAVLEGIAGSGTALRCRAG